MHITLLDVFHDGGMFNVKYIVIFLVLNNTIRLPEYSTYYIYHQNISKVTIKTSN